MADLKPTAQLIERIHWLIRLRWIAVGGVSLVVLFASGVLKITLSVLPLFAITVFLAVYNLIFFLFLFLYKGQEPFARVNRIANLQISLDLLALTSLIHFSGGIENPFIFYFIFHMIIAGILLSRRATYLQASFAVLLFLLMMLLEYFGILPHYCLNKFIGYHQHNNILYLGGVSFVFITTLYIAVYMATSISQRLRQREKALEEANALLLEKDRIKSEYVLRVSHDIKEHLSAIQGCLEPVVNGLTGGLNPQQLDLVSRASQRADKLMFFVKALLEITRLKLIKELKMDYFSFAEMLSEAVSQIIPQAKNKNISVSSKIQPGIDKIRGAREEIQEGIGNILANCVKYTPPHGKIDIEVSDKGNAILIRIADTGIGIPKNELPKVFDEFYRASNAKKVERDGTGLGLSIAKQVIERHQGRIWVESEEGQGSRFSIQLPK